MNDFELLGRVNGNRKLKKKQQKTRILHRTQKGKYHMYVYCPLFKNKSLW